eukprot:jgi/Mesvir1/11151/Mv04593-RA.1
MTRRPATAARGTKRAAKSGRKTARPRGRKHKVRDGRAVANTGSGWVHDTSDDERERQRLRDELEEERIEAVENADLIDDPHLRGPRDWLASYEGEGRAEAWRGQVHRPVFENMVDQIVENGRRAAFAAHSPMEALAALRSAAGHAYWLRRRMERWERRERGAQSRAIRARHDEEERRIRMARERRARGL